MSRIRPCPHCQAPTDAAARFCAACGGRVRRRRWLTWRAVGLALAASAVFAIVDYRDARRTLERRRSGDIEAIREVFGIVDELDELRALRRTGPLTPERSRDVDGLRSFWGHGSALEALVESLAGLDPATLGWELRSFEARGGVPLDDRSRLHTTYFPSTARTGDVDSVREYWFLVGLREGPDAAWTWHPAWASVISRPYDAHSSRVLDLRVHRDEENSPARLRVWAKRQRRFFGGAPSLVGEPPVSVESLDEVRTPRPAGSRGPVAPPEPEASRESVAPAEPPR